MPARQDKGKGRRSVYRNATAGNSAIDCVPLGGMR